MSAASADSRSANNCNSALSAGGCKPADRSRTCVTKLRWYPTVANEVIDYKAILDAALFEHVDDDAARGRCGQKRFPIRFSATGSMSLRHPIWDSINPMPHFCQYAQG